MLERGMLKISRQVEYAIMILFYLDKHPDQFHSARDMAEELRIPVDSAAKICKSLTKCQALRTKMGVLGGYQLAYSLDRIDLLQLGRWLGEVSDVVSCLGGDHQCLQQGPCSIKGPMKHLGKHIQKIMGEITLSHLRSGEQL